MRRLDAANSKIAAAGAGASPDMYGQTFQRLIPDRKKLAAFYTKPAAAALLAAVAIPDEWRDAESAKRLRMADFACGTGTLLLAGYRKIASNYEMAGGSMRDLHDTMMAECLIGADVLPVTAHLTATGLTGVYPDKGYEHTRIYQPTQGGENNRIGSLEWIKQDATLDATERRLTGAGTRGETEAPAHGSHDVVLMNPPYVRSRGPGGRSDRADARQLFTAFGATDEDRRRMGARAAKLFGGKPSAKRSAYCADKRAGLATFFADLAHAKLRGGGCLGLVLPMTAATGVNWRAFREIMRTRYADPVVISGRFSADTGMGEIIVSARKLRDGEKPSGRGTFVALDGEIGSVLEAECVGNAVRRARPRRLEGGPHGGTRITVGGDEVGAALDCPVEPDWSAAEVSNYALLQIAHGLGTSGTLYAPPSFVPAELRTVPLRDVADIGPSHLQIRGGDARPGASTSYSGPFDVREYRPGCPYPALWNNDRATQQRMAVSPDASLEPRRGCDQKAVRRIWDSASNLHLNLDVRTTSQSLAASYTAKPVVGGRAWPSIIAVPEHARGLAVWCNSTLGVLCRWAMSNRQQPGRSTSSRTAILDLPVPEKEGLARLGGAYGEFAVKKLDRITNLWKDPARIAMDDAVLELLGLDADLDYIRRCLCAEPSVNGGRMPDGLRREL